MVPYGVCQFFTSMVDCRPRRPMAEENMSDIKQLQSVIDDNFTATLVPTRRVLAQHLFALKSADLLNKEMQQNQCDGKLRSAERFGEATVNEYTFKFEVLNNYEVKTKMKVIFEESNLAEESSEQRIADILSTLSEREFHTEALESIGTSSLLDNKSSATSIGASSFEQGYQYITLTALEPHWDKLLQYWKKFTSSFRRKGFSNMNLIFCGQNGERVKVECRPRPSDQNEGEKDQVKSQCRSVKPTIMVFLNKKNYEEIVFRVDEINKRTLGRLIIALCGNEGAEETTEQTGLRRLLQAFITEIEGKPITCFNNVKLSLYGKDSMSFHILAGKSPDPKLIVGYVDSKGDFHINEKKTSYCTIS